MPPRVCVRSSINIDEFFELEHIVRFGETIASTGYSRRPGGKGANCATAIAKASARNDAVDFCGTINAGDSWLRDVLTSYGVNASKPCLAESSETATGRAIIQLSTTTADNSIILFPGTNHLSYALPNDFLTRYTHLLVQNEIPIQQTCEALLQAREAGITTVFNPSPIPSRDQVASLIPWSAIDWIIVNEDEAADLALAFGHAESMVRKDSLQALAESLSGSTGLVVTKGADGVEMLLKNPSDEGGFSRLESPCGRAAGPIINTTGAGDTFAGYLTAQLLQISSKLPTESQMRSILLLAGEAATACCEKNGAMEAIPTLADMEQRYAQKGERMPHVQ